MTNPTWDTAQYLRFAAERGRPFADLVARIDAARGDRGDPGAVVDLGCGPGNLTATLAARWPGARVTGVDSSEAMIAAARGHEDGRVAFVRADIRDWAPAGAVDVVVSNAALHWIPDHVALFPTYVGWLAPGGVFAFQVPANAAEPSHTEVRALCAEPRWRDRLGSLALDATVLDVPAYVDALARLGLRVDAWQTTYHHVLTGEDAVLEWVKGTALRPVLGPLSEGEQREFCAELAERLRAAYPPAPYGTVFPFTRRFAVAVRG